MVRQGVDGCERWMRWGLYATGELETLLTKLAQIARCGLALAPVRQGLKPPGKYLIILDTPIGIAMQLAAHAVQQLFNLLPVIAPCRSCELLQCREADLPVSRRLEQGRQGSGGRQYCAAMHEARSASRQQGREQLTQLLRPAEIVGDHLSLIQR